MTPPDSDKQTVATTQRSFDILEVIHREGGASLEELSGELALSKSTIHRHLQTLTQLGYAKKNGREYKISLWFLDFGNQAREERPFFEVAKQKAEELCAKTEEKVWCIAEEAGLGVRLYVAEPDFLVKTHSRVGQRIHLHQIAEGKAILAGMESEQVREMISRHGLPEITDHTITSEEDLLDDLELIQERGYAINEEEMVEGINAVGVAISDGDGLPIGGISVSGPKSRLDRSTLEDNLASQVISTASEIEINLRSL